MWESEFPGMPYCASAILCVQSYRMRMMLSAKASYKRCTP